MSKVIKTPIHEMIVPDDGDYFISYNPNCTTFGDGSETALVNVPYGSDYGVPTTYYILLGDWREKYTAVIDKGYEACLEIYKKNQEYKSSWSNNL